MRNPTGYSWWGFHRDGALPVFKKQCYLAGLSPGIDQNELQLAETQLSRGPRYNQKKPGASRLNYIKEVLRL